MMNEKRHRKGGALSRGFLVVMALCCLGQVASAVRGNDGGEVWRSKRYGGANALYCLLRIFGYSPHYLDLRRKVDEMAGEGRVTALDLKRVSDSEGLSLRARRMSVDDLRSARLPVVAHLEQSPQTGVFVVILTCTGGGIDYFVGQSATIHKLSMEEFRRRWRGVALVREKGTAYQIGFGLGGFGVGLLGALTALRRRRLLTKSTVGLGVIMVVGGGAAHGAGDSGQEEATGAAERQVKVDGSSAGDWGSVERLLVRYKEEFDERVKQRVTAFGGPSRLYNTEGYSGFGYPWKMDPYRQEYYINQGRTCLRQPFMRSFEIGEIKPGSVMPGTFPLNRLLPVLPRWFLNEYDAPRAQGTEAVLPVSEALKSGKYDLVNEAELVNGESCRVFEREGIDRIWLARGSSLCVMRREIWDGRSKKQIPRYRILTEEIDEVAPGLWFPKVYRYQFLEPKGHPQSGESVETEFTVIIQDCLINGQVPKSTFEVSYQPGALQWNDDGSFTQVEPGGVELLDEIAGFFRDDIGLPSRRGGEGRRGRRATVWALIGGLIGISFGVWYVRRPVNTNEWATGGIKK